MIVFREVEALIRHQIYDPHSFLHSGPKNWFTSRSIFLDLFSRRMTLFMSLMFEWCNSHCPGVAWTKAKFYKAMQVHKCFPIFAGFQPWKSLQRVVCVVQSMNQRPRFLRGTFSKKEGRPKQEANIILIPFPYLYCCQCRFFCCRGAMLCHRTWLRGLFWRSYS